MLTKRLNIIPRNPLRFLIISDQILHRLRQIAEIRINLDEVLVRARRDHQVVMMLQPLELMRHNHAVAVLQILQARGVGDAFGVRDVFVGAVLVHAEDLPALRLLGLLFPAEDLHVRPIMSPRNIHQLFPHQQLQACAAPYQLVLLLLPGELGVHGGRFHLYFEVGADLGLRPGPVAEIGHQPVAGFVGAPGVGPFGFGGAGGDVVGHEDEFDVWEGFGGGDDCAVDGVKCSLLAHVDRFFRGVEDVELGLLAESF